MPYLIFSTKSVEDLVSKERGFKAKKAGTLRPIEGSWGGGITDGASTRSQEASVSGWSNNICEPE